MQDIMEPTEQKYWLQVIDLGHHMNFEIGFSSYKTL